MKKALFSAILGVLLTASFAVSAMAVGDGSAVYGTPVVDGVIDEVWSTAESMPIEILKGGTQTDLTASWRGLWNEKSFYVLVEVSDAIHTFEGGVSSGDGVEFYFDPLRTEADAYNYPDVCFFGIKGNDVNNVSYDGIEEALEAFKPTYNVVAVETDDGFIYEAEFKLAEFTPSIKMVEGTQIGFDIQINDKNDNSEDRTAAYGWFDEADLAWQFPFALGAVELVPAPEIVPEAPVAEEVVIEEPAAEEAEETAAVEEPVVEEPVVEEEVTAVAEPAAPQTFDMAIASAVSALLAVSGYAVSRKKRK